MSTVTIIKNGINSCVLESIVATLAMRNLKLEEIDPFALRELNACTYSMLCTDHKKCTLTLEEHKISSRDEHIGALLHKVASGYAHVDVKRALQVMLVKGPEYFEMQFAVAKEIAVKQSGRVVYDQRGWSVKKFEISRAA